MQFWAIVYWCPSSLYFWWLFWWTVCLRICSEGGLFLEWTAFIVRSDTIWLNSIYREGTTWIETLCCLDQVFEISPLRLVFKTSEWRWIWIFRTFSKTKCDWIYSSMCWCCWWAQINLPRSICTKFWFSNTSPSREINRVNALSLN